METWTELHCGVESNTYNPERGPRCVVVYECVSACVLAYVCASVHVSRHTCVCAWAYTIILPTQSAYVCQEGCRESLVHRLYRSLPKLVQQPLRYLVSIPLGQICVRRALPLIFRGFSALSVNAQWLCAVCSALQIRTP